MAVEYETPYGPVDAVANWLQANGVDPQDVPVRGPIAIEPDPDSGKQRIRYAALLRNEDGHRYHDETTNDVAQAERTAPLKVDPPANVQVSAST